MSSEHSAELTAEEAEESRRRSHEEELTWARAQLHAETDGPEGVWQSLQKCGFLPDEAQIAALEILAGLPAANTSVATADCRRIVCRSILEREIRDFAKCYFDLELVERYRHWRRLRQRCDEFAGLVLWLDGLQPGLYVVRPRLETLDGDVRLVVESICSLFTTSPGELARSRRNASRQFSGAGDRTTRAVWTVKQKHAGLAKLMPIFLAAIDPETTRQIKFSSIMPAGERAPETPSSDDFQWLKVAFMVAPFLLMVLTRLPTLTKSRDGASAVVVSPSAISDIANSFTDDSQQMFARIQKYGIVRVESTDRDRIGRQRLYRILGPGPEELIGEAYLRLFGIPIDRYLRDSPEDLTPADALTPENQGQSAASGVDANG